MVLSQPFGAHPGASPTAYLGRATGPWNGVEVDIGGVDAGGVVAGEVDAGANQTVVPFGYGKGALAAALRALDPPAGANVLLPAAIPHRVPEAIRAAGAAPRFYRVDDSLRPDLEDVERRVDDDSVALVAVQYFGFPQPSFDALRAVASDEDLLLVDDASHGALSRVDGDPLGSFGDVGFTSLHKLLPVPNGAVLYVADDRPTPAPPPEPRRGGTDWRFLTASACRAAADGLQGRAGTDPRVAGVGVLDGAVRVGAAVLQQLASACDPGQPPDWNVPMSGLTRRFLEGFEASDVVARRRARYREWLEVLEPLEGVRPLFETLPSGVCPWVCPVVCSDPERFVGTTARRVGGTFRWPTLPGEVQPGAYPTAERLSRTLVALPVHQGIPSGRIRRLVATDPAGS